MKLATRILLPVAFSLTAGVAMAEGPIEGNEVFASTATSTLSRADVREEAIAARDAGLIVRGEIVPVQVADSGVGKTRDQVMAEYFEARSLGLVAVGEIQPIATPAQAEQIRLAGVRATQVVMN